MQASLFPKQIRDELGVVGGITGARLVRADDALLYIAKDEAADPRAPTVRASEFFWLALGRAIGLACAIPEILVMPDGRKQLGVRCEQNLVARDAAAAQIALLSGRVHDGGTHLSRIFAFDLFCANWDRHPGNYLVLNEGGAAIVFAIDFSHVVTVPAAALHDPAADAGNATRMFFPALVAAYGGPDIGAAVEVLDRLQALPQPYIEGILTGIPPDWLSDPQKDDVRSWWGDGRSAARLAAIKEGVQNGTLM